MTDPVSNLEVYLVGGAVRDELMGLKVQDQDWMVVGATPEEMIRRGFRPVGKDFPVFLHPHTGEEYALARSEKKIGKGYRGFEVISNPKISLEQDLVRRDLTINAIAKAADGKIIDPYGGVEDIQKGRIRHVSEAFKEDPVRILRTARFAARYYKKGFSIVSETWALMREMVEQNEADALVAERVWQETEAALVQGNSAVFFEALRRCGALERIMPEVDALFGVPQRKDYHPEIDTGLHTMMALRAAEKLSDNPLILFSVLVHDLGKALTPAEILPSHRGHERRGIEPINTLCDRLRVPKKYRSLALKVCEFHLHCHRIEALKPSTILKLLEGLDGFRQPETVAQFTLCCTADIRGRRGFEENDYTQADLLSRYHQAVLAVDSAAVAQKYDNGEKIKQAVRQKRIKAIRQASSQELSHIDPS